MLAQITPATASHLKNVTERGNLRAKVAKILQIMHQRGFDAQIYSSMRSRAEQAQKVAAGVSQTTKSYHLPGPDGLARAVDIADAGAKDSKGRSSPWNADRAFWILLGRLALTQGCGWGGLFGLPLSVKVKLVRFLLDRDRPFRPENWQGKLGWDPAHVEARPGWLDRLIARYVSK